MAFSPDGARLASGGWDKTVRLWDAATGKPLAVLEGHTDQVQSVAFSPDGARLASASEDKTVRLWIAREGPADLEKRRLFWWEQQAEAAEHDGRWFAAAFDLGRLIAAEPTNASLYARRCKAYAFQGLWGKAVADLLLGAALSPPAVDIDRRPRPVPGLPVRHRPVWTR